MDNRISQLTIQSSLDRTAVKSDFGALLARGITTGVGVASAIVPGGAVISAAVNQTIGQVSRPGVMQGGPRAAVGGHGTMPTTASSSAEGSQSTMSFDSQSQLVEQQKQASLQYLALQNQMQQESREYNAISNILKVRHESAKTAINNVR
ncbi:MAG TPA: hypothetical protein VGK67_31075 [Myxococcales bacterium]|jgi:hypothetical protein